MYPLPQPPSRQRRSSHRQQHHYPAAHAAAQSRSFPSELQSAGLVPRDELVAFVPVLQQRELRQGLELIQLRVRLAMSVSTPDAALMAE